MLENAELQVTLEVNKLGNVRCKDTAETKRLLSMLEFRRREFKGKTGKEMPDQTVTQVLWRATDEETSREGTLRNVDRIDGACKEMKRSFAYGQRKCPRSWTVGVLVARGLGDVDGFDKGQEEEDESHSLILQTQARAKEATATSLVSSVARKATRRARVLRSLSCSMLYATCAEASDNAGEIARLQVLTKDKVGIGKDGKLSSGFGFNKGTARKGFRKDFEKQLCL